MKKLFACLLLVASIANLAVASVAADKGDKMPLDPNVKYGKLENGLTYYVRANQEPKGRASFYIAQNIGAINENDDQDGLAHFLEHMAFNGTEHFPDKGLLNYLEQYGVTFGRNINAYTSLDETVYNLSNVPTNNQNLMDSALLVLHDWSNYLSLDAEEIDSERGVIREEWRTRRSGGMRLYLEKNKVLYKGSKYAERDVIGELDVINNFEHKVIRDFYHDFYRTDLQAIVVVGDFDASTMEAKIKEMFAHIPAVKDAKERKYYDVPGNKEPIVDVLTDPEAQRLNFNLYFKHQATEFAQKDKNYYRQAIINNLYSMMMGNRFTELVQKGTPPFVNAYAAYYNIVRKMDVYNVGVTLSSDNVAGGIEAALVENARAVQHGFSTSELDRVKKEYMSYVEKQYKERNKQNNDQLARELYKHYLTNEPAPGIEFDLEFLKEILPNVTVEELNALGKQWNANENLVLIVTGPEKDGINYPSKEELLGIYNKVAQSKQEAYVDNVITEPLMAEMPAKGAVSSEKALDAVNATEWTLANGVKVVVKQTDYKENEILLSAFSNGGSSLYSAEELPSVALLPNFVGSFGINKFDKISLDKLLTGKVVRVSPYVSTLQEGFSGSSSVEDFETMLQLVNLYFEAPRFDEDAFKALQTRYAAMVKNRSSDINQAFRDSITLISNNYHERTFLMDEATINNLSFETMKKAFGERFNNAGDFTFVFVGNIDPAKAKPMIETYLGSLKSNNNKENWKDNKVEYPAKDTYCSFEKEMQTPKTSIFIDMHGDMEYSLENKLKFDILTQLLRKKYLDEIREKEGGSYGVGVYGGLEHFPEESYSLKIVFDTDPEKADKLKGIVYNEVSNLFKKGVEEVDLKEAKSNAIKVHEENLRKNNYWLSKIKSMYVHNDNFLNLDEFTKEVSSISKKDMEAFAKKYFNGADKVEVVMNPAK